MEAVRIIEHGDDGFGPSTAGIEKKQRIRAEGHLRLVPVAHSRVLEYLCK